MIRAWLCNCIHVKQRVIMKHIWPNAGHLNPRWINALMRNYIPQEIIYAITCPCQYFSFSVLMKGDQGLVQDGISVRTQLKPKSHEISFAHNLYSSYPIVWKVCTDTAVVLPCFVQKIQTDWTTETGVTGDWDFAIFEFSSVCRCSVADHSQNQRKDQG